MEIHVPVPESRILLFSPRRIVKGIIWFWLQAITPIISPAMANLSKYIFLIRIQNPIMESIYPVHLMYDSLGNFVYWLQVLVTNSSPAMTD